MEVPKELLDKWAVLRSPGDPKEIAELMPEEIRVVPQTIRNVFNDGQCSDDVFTAMADFYQAKADNVAKYLLPAGTNQQG